MKERQIESIQTVRCPNCQHGSAFTDSHDDWELHHQRFENSPVLWVPGVDVGGWRPSFEVRLKGKVGLIQRKDLDEFRVYPILCATCKKVFIARLGVRNIDDVRHYEEFIRPNSPPMRDGDEVIPKWGMLGVKVKDFVEEVRAIKNPVVRSSVSRKMKAVLDVKNGQGQSVWDAVAEFGVPKPDVDE